MKKINFTSTNDTVSIKFNNKNSGDDLIMPEFDINVYHRIVKDNEFYMDEISTNNFLKDNPQYTKYSHVMVSKKFKSSKIIFAYKNEESEGDREVDVYFKGRLFISTYICIDLPKGYDFDLRNRSGNFKRNINIIMGLIDNPYTGEMGLQIVPLTDEFTKLEFSKHENQISYAQLKINKTYNRFWNFLHVLDFREIKSVIKKDKIRGVFGFGSTGK